MADANRYVMLLSSLPYHGPLFGAEQTPLSRIRLDQRLRLLPPDEAECLRTARALVEFAQQDVNRADAAWVVRTKRLLDSMNQEFVRDLVTWRLEVRTLVSALRRRHRGETAPRDDRWGFGRWLGSIRQHWNEPAFGLERAFPWLPQAKRALDTGAALELERLLGAAAWNHLERRSDGHHFDFEAVVIYVMRWDLIASWTSYDGGAAIRRFEELVDAAMAEVEAGLEAGVEQSLRSSASAARPASP